MKGFTRSVRFLKDIAFLGAAHPGWLLRSFGKHMVMLRARGNAEHLYGVPRICHHHLDKGFNNLAVELGSGFHVALPKAAIVSRFCALLKPKRVLEIGTFRGGMTLHIARNTDPDCRIWTLDIPSDHVAGMASEMIESDVRLASINDRHVGEQWHGTPEAEKITQLWGDSLTFDLGPYAPFDLVYVDGSHAEPWVARDTENAFSFLSETGAILWDDCYWSGVLDVLGRYAEDHPIYIFEDGKTAGFLRRDGQPVVAEPGAGSDEAEE